MHVLVPFLFHMISNPTGGQALFCLWWRLAPGSFSYYSCIHEHDFQASPTYCLPGLIFDTYNFAPFFVIIFDNRRNPALLK